MDLKSKLRIKLILKQVPSNPYLAPFCHRWYWHFLWFFEDSPLEIRLFFILIFILCVGIVIISWACYYSLMPSPNFLKGFHENVTGISVFVSICYIKVRVKVLVTQSCLTLWDPMEFFRQEYWSGLPFPSPGNLPNPGVEPRSPTMQADDWAMREAPFVVWLIVKTDNLEKCIWEEKFFKNQLDL